MQAILAKIFARVILGPANWLLQFIVSNILRYMWSMVLDAYEAWKNKEEVKKIREAEEALKKAKTEEEVDDALEDIRRSSRQSFSFWMC